MTLAPQIGAQDLADSRSLSRTGSPETAPIPGPDDGITALHDAAGCPVRESRRKIADGNARIAETLCLYIRLPDRFGDFASLHLVQQGFAIQAVAAVRCAARPRQNAAPCLRLSETWPVASWSSLDYGGFREFLHHLAQQFLAPNWARAIQAEEGFKFVAVNVTGGAVEAENSVSRVSTGGAERVFDRACRDLGSGKAEFLFNLPAAAFSGNALCLLEWRKAAGSGTEIVGLDYDLRPPVRWLEIDGDRVTITSEALALFVPIEADCPGWFSDNAFAVRAGQPETLIFIPHNRHNHPPRVLH